MHRGKRVLEVFVLVLTILLFPLIAFCDPGKSDQESFSTLDEVVVTATRDYEDVQQVPANVSIVTAREIERSGAANLVEVLERLEGVPFRNYGGNAAKSVIDLRGFGGDNPFGKTLILLDGRRLNRPDMSSINWLQIPLSQIERVEVVRGAGSVLYGDAAVGGVINIITKKGRGAPRYRASVEAGSFGLHREQAGVAGAVGKARYALSGENNVQDGWRDRSRLSSRGGAVDLGYAAGERLDMSLKASFNRTDYQMPGALTKAQMKRDRRQYQPATPENWANAAPDDDGVDRYVNVHAGLTSFLGPAGEFDLQVLYGKKDLEINMPSWTSGQYADIDTDTFGVTPKYVLTRDLFGRGNKLTLGVDYYREPYKKVFFGTRKRTEKTRWADLMRESLGYYARDEFRLMKRLLLSAGYRSERTVIEGEATDLIVPANDFSDREKTYRAKAYEIGLTWLAGEESKLFAKVASVYRIPFLDEVASFNGFGGGFLQGLDREKGVSLEAGAVFHPLDRLKIGLTLFRIDMEDEIQYVYVTSWSGYNQNVGKTRHDGAEASLSWQWENRVRFFGIVSWHRATFENGPNNGKDMPLVPRWQAGAGAEIELPHGWTLRPELRHVGHAYLSGDNDNNAKRLKDYTLLNLYLSWRTSFGKFKATAFAGVENLADVKYASFGSDNASWGGLNTYYPMPGIALKGGLSLEY